MRRWLQDNSEAGRLGQLEEKVRGEIHVVIQHSTTFGRFKTDSNPLARYRPWFRELLIRESTTAPGFRTLLARVLRQAG
jgi:hypothetical protein